MNKYQEALDYLRWIGSDGYYKKKREKSFDILQELIDEADMLDKAFDLYIDWSTQCHFGYDNIPDEFEKYEKEINEKELGYNEGLKYIAIEEARKL